MKITEETLFQYIDFKTKIKIKPDCLKQKQQKNYSSVLLKIDCPIPNIIAELHT